MFAVGWPQPYYTQRKFLFHSQLFNSYRTTRVTRGFHYIKIPGFIRKLVSMCDSVQYKTTFYVLEGSFSSGNSRISKGSWGAISNLLKLSAKVLYCFETTSHWYLLHWKTCKLQVPFGNGYPILPQIFNWCHAQFLFKQLSQSRMIHRRSLSYTL